MKKTKEIKTQWTSFVTTELGNMSNYILYLDQKRFISINLVTLFTFIIFLAFVPVGNRFVLEVTATQSTLDRGVHLLALAWLLQIIFSIRFRLLKFSNRGCNPRVLWLCSVVPWNPRRSRTYFMRSFPRPRVATPVISVIFEVPRKITLRLAILFRLFWSYRLWLRGSCLVICSSTGRTRWSWTVSSSRLFLLWDWFILPFGDLCKAHVCSSLHRRCCVGQRNRPIWCRARVFTFLKRVNHWLLFRLR